MPDELEGAATMPKNDVYGLKVVDDLTGKFEYSPPFEISIPDSKYIAGNSVNLLGTHKSETPENEQKTSSLEKSVTTHKAETAIKSHITTPFATTFATATTPESASSTEIPIHSSPLTGTSVSTSTGTSSKPEESSGPSMEAIFVASGAGVGGVAILIVGVAVWARIRSDKQKIAQNPPKSFRDRRSIDGASPVFDRGEGPGEFGSAPARHSRFPSTSSFGDNARPSEVFERQNAILPKPLSPIQDSPPPTPFSAPPLNLPVSNRNPGEQKPYAFAVSPHFHPPDWKPPPSPSSQSPILALGSVATTPFKAYQPSNSTMDPSSLCYQPPKTVAPYRSLQTALNFSHPGQKARYTPRSYASALKKNSTWDNHPT